MSTGVERPIILTYGSVELCLCDAYAPGDTIIVDRLLRLQIVDRVEKADGIVVLGFASRSAGERPSCLCMLFTHYYKRPFLDVVDHAKTVLYLREPTEAVRKLTEMAVTQDLFAKSIIAAVAYNPSVRYL